MPNLSFKKEVEVRVVYNNTRYKIDVSAVDFGQTFQEKSYEVKTLHNQGSFEGSVINQANPAEFSLNTPLLKEDTNRVIFDRLLDSATFDLYISTQYDVWKLEKCVIQDGTFEINKSKPLRLAVSGEASKLSNYIPSGSDIAATAITGKYVYITSVGSTNFRSAGASVNEVGHTFIATANATGTGVVKEVVPGTTESTNATTTYIVPDIATLTLGSEDVSESIVNINVELQNDIEWNGYDTLHGALSATNAATSMYPEKFTSGTKVLGGSIRKYLNDNSTSVLTWDSNTSLRLRAGKDIGKKVTGITVVSQGSGYNSVPEVTIHGGGGTGATATATLTGTAVTGLTLTNQGSGYLRTPTVTIAESPGSYANATASLTMEAESVVYGVDLNISNCSFTNRMTSGPIYTESYDWRMTQRPTALSSVITYTTQE